MLRIRTAALSAVIASFALGAAAQEAAAPGKPLPLLQVAQQHGKAKLHHRMHRTAETAAATHLEPASAKPRLARHSIVKKHVKKHKVLAAAPAQPAPVPDQTAAAPAAAVAAPAGVWPAVDTAAPAASAMPAPAAPPADVAIAPVVNTDANEIAAENHTVQPPAPTKADAPDLTASNHDTVAKADGPGDPVPPQPIVRAMVAAPAAADAGPHGTVGSMSWIMQVLAALGGAIAAGVVAWFLIGPAPQRSY